MTAPGKTSAASFAGQALESNGKVLADTDDGPTSTESGTSSPIASRKGQGAMVVGFIHEALKPARWRGRSAEFEGTRANLNEALGEDGELHMVQAARTVPEAEDRADRLRGKLKARGVRDDVLRFCRAELLQRNYFHAVLEATKSAADKIRTRCRRSK